MSVHFFFFELQPAIACLSKFYHRNYNAYDLLILFFNEYISKKPRLVVPSDIAVTRDAFSEKKPVFYPYKSQCKSEKTRRTANMTKPTVAGITKLKFNESVLTTEIKIDNSNLTCSDKNGNRSGVTCFTRNYLSHNRRFLLPLQIQNLFFFYCLNF